MFYVNNKRVLGIFLNGNNYNYMSFGFGKIIPENRSAQFAYVNLAQRYLSQYRVEYGNIQSGYDNFPIARLDYPVNGIFHSPLTYYYGGNIVPTKNVPVYINNGYSAIRGTVYNDINVSGNIVYFAENTDFQGHNVNIHPENFRSNSPYFNGTVMDNCTNFILHSGSRLSKSHQVTLYSCKKFIGWFNFFGDNDGTRFPGFRGFLHTCRDGVFSFNLMNMHGGGSDGIVTNYYNFSCISNCNNIKLNINGEPWQAWVHPNCYASNCNITTRYIVPGFDRMRDCNFNLYIPRYADVEKSAGYSILSNSSNCNVYFDGLNSNIYSFRNVGWGLYLFEDLNDCNLNLLLNNSNGLDYRLGGRINNCNIYFDNMNAKQIKAHCWGYMNNCNITGNVINANTTYMALVAYSTNVNLNVDASLTENFSLLWNSSNINGDVILGNFASVQHSNNLILNLYNGNTFDASNVEHSRFNSNGTNICGTNINNCMFEIHNSKDFEAHTASNCNFNMYNSVGTALLTGLNNVKFVERGGANYNITLLDNCYNSWIYANTMYGTIENLYNTRIELKNNNAYFGTWRVNNCEITGFPTRAIYTFGCKFNVSIPQAVFRNSSYITWDNVWPHAIPRGSDGWNTLYRTKAGLRSVDNFSDCYLNCNNGSLVYYSTTFDNTNNMQCDIKKFYNGTVTANLPNYNMEIKLNVDCNTLNLGIFQAGPPHGFQNATISADNIYAKGSGAGGSTYVYLNCDTKIYCKDYCNTPFYSGVRAETNVLQPVVLINNYKHSNSLACQFQGGLTRIGRLNFKGDRPADLTLGTGACVFINNAVLGYTVVSGNSLLFLGGNVTRANAINATSGGRVRNAANLTDDDIRFIDRGQLAWNLWDYGPWGSQSLINYCKNV